VPLDLPDLLDSWLLHLRAERKSGQTIKAYGDGVRAYLKWCGSNDKPAILDRRQVREFTDWLLTSGIAPPPPPRGTSPSVASRAGAPRKANRGPIRCWG